MKSAFGEKKTDLVHIYDGVYIHNIAKNVVFGKPEKYCEDYVEIKVTFNKNETIAAASLLRFLLLVSNKEQIETYYYPGFYDDFLAINDKPDVIKWLVGRIKEELNVFVFHLSGEDLAHILQTQKEKNGLRGLSAITVNTAQLNIDIPANNYSNSIPVMDTEFYVPNDFALAFQMAKHTIKSGGFLNIFVSGPSGYGKTSFFDQIAKDAGVDILHWNCATMLDPEKWFGKIQIKDGETFFEETEFTKALKNGNVVILLDEINRVAPEISNSLLSILDYRRKTHVGNQELTLGKGIIFGMTANIGYQYTGTAELDVALKNRNLINLKVSRLPADIEKSIVKTAYPNVNDEIIHFVVNICNAIRDIIEKDQTDDWFEIDVSTRTAKGLVEMAQILTDANLPIDKSQLLNYAIFNTIEPHHAATVMDKLNVEGVI